MIAAAQVWAKAVDFMRSRAGGRCLAAVAVLAAVLLARVHWIGVGVDREKAAEAERLKAARPAIARVEADGKAITAATDQRAVERTAEIRTITRTLKEEVPVYVTVEADRRCAVSAGFVSLYNQAVAGVPQVPRPSGVVLDAPSGIALSAVADTDVENLGVCHEWRDAALACRAWAREQAETWKSNIRTATPSP